MAEYFVVNVNHDEIVRLIKDMDVYELSELLYETYDMYSLVFSYLEDIKNNDKQAFDDLIKEILN